MNVWHRITCPVCRPAVLRRRRRFIAWVADQGHIAWARQLVKKGDRG